MQNTSDGAFFAYAILLVVSGLLLLVIGAVGFGQTKGARIVDGLFGAAFLGYGIYLLFIFTGGEYRLFYYPFIVPVVAIVQAVKARKARRGAEAQAVAPAPRAEGQHPVG